MRKLLVTLAISAGLALSSLAPVHAEDIDVTFLLISDIDKMSGKKDKRGGFARVNAIVKSERAKGGNVIYAHAGDFLSPSLLSGFDKGEHVIDLMNVSPPDFISPGNHEFDFGKDLFLKRIREVHSTILSANLRKADGGMVAGIKDNHLLTYGDASDPMKSLKIGIVGLTTADTPDLSSPGDLTFANTLETAKANATSLRKAGADIVVAIQHEEFSTDLDLYNSGTFDFVLSGHDHNLTLLFNGRSVMAESRSQGDIVVLVDVKFSITEKRGKRRVRWWPKFRVIDTDTVTPDPETLAKVAKYQETLSKELDVPVGTVATELDSRRATIRSQESAIGNLIADAQRAAVSADIAIANGGGIRGDKTYDAGTKLTRRDILTELPFGNKTLLLEVTGAQVKEALENGVSQVEKVAGRFPHVSGMSFAFDKSKPAGSRVSDVKVKGVALDMAKTYSLAVNDYIAGGGDGYRVLRKAKILIDKLAAKLMANDVMVYVRKMGSVSPKVEGRIKAL